MAHLGKGVDLSAKENPMDLLFGIGFRIGFLFVIVGMMLAYIPFIDRSVTLTLDYVGFFHSFKMLPKELQVVVAGIMLMGVGLIMHQMKKLIEDFINLLFWEKDKVA